MGEQQDRGYLVLTRAIKDKLLLMSGHVESMIGDSMHALTHHDTALARQTAAHDVFVDRLEVDLDDRCLVALARFHPVGSDLRFLTLALKMVTDLERLGDLAVNICERVLELPQPAGPFCWDGANAMALHARDMVHRAVTSFVDMDAEGAEQVIHMDDEVDRLYNEFFQHVFDAMGHEPQSLRAGIHALSIGKWLERMADHATNLAEHAVFLARGEDVRHTTNRRRPLSKASSSQ